MAKRSREVSHDSSDDEAPEAVSFGTSKKAAKGAQDALQQHHTAQKQKQKEKNRAIDRALKDRSASTKGKGKTAVVGSGKPSKKVEATLEEDEESELGDEEEGVGEGPSRKELEERMARAMMEAEGESGSEEEGFGSGDDVDMEGEDEEMSDEEDGSEGEDENEDEELLDEEQSDGDEDEEMESEGEDEEDDEDEDAPSTRSLSAPRKDDYLPDHLFKSVLSNAGKKIVFDDAPLLSAEASPPRKRKRTRRTSKDVLLGSRTIRTLPKTNAVVSSAVTKGLKPPRRVDKFVKTSLNLKGDAAKAKSKGWNRQPANLGVMKRQGPAAHFVRAS